jgi:hypothetical protein
MKSSGLNASALVLTSPLATWMTDSSMVCPICSIVIPPERSHILPLVQVSERDQNVIIGVQFQNHTLHHRLSLATFILNLTASCAR